MDSADSLYCAKQTLIELLSLVANPEICQKLPKYVQAFCGKSLLRMYELFDDLFDNSDIVTDEITLHELDIYTVGQKRIEWLYF